MSARATALVLMALVAMALAAYANHFQNEFHFDDFHTVVNNPAIRRLGNIPRFFTDATLFSIEPEGRTWRPVVSASLAIDYRLGGGLRPFWFHLSTFFWFCVQLAVMFLLFRRITGSEETAFAAAAVYGVHPVCAETVNYIIQRGEVYDALGVTASLWLFVAYPGQRKYLWYLVPAVLAYLAKAPAMVFPFILLAYVGLFERKAWRATLPVFAVTAVAAVLTAKMTPASYSAGAENPALYRLTQPWVALHYFRCFFVPAGLSADSGWDTVASAWSGEAVAGYLFAAAAIGAAAWCARRSETRPVAFGLAWFLVALAPAAWLPLADVMNDHRMYFPFVGLTLAVFQAARLAVRRAAIRRAWIRAGVAVILAAAAWGTHERNRVWRSERSLWYEVTVKSPENGRGLMNYGVVLMDARDYAGALPYLERAEMYWESVHLEENLGMTYRALGREREAEEHFQRAEEMRR